MEGADVPSYATVARPRRAAGTWRESWKPPIPSVSSAPLGFRGLPSQCLITGEEYRRESGWLSGGGLVRTPPRQALSKNKNRNTKSLVKQNRQTVPSLSPHDV
jgi:hypothetical protein